ncbi:alpha/beta fold hydrolase [Streptomyces sp. NPDC021969]|uniref:thioesterase II family protein n=1 Tax=unclassified Streptomyces TaxID=2593676 RepID=UPI00340973DF
MTVPDTRTSPWLRRYHDAAADAVTLVCFPHSGGSASYFHPVSAALAPGVAVVAVQYPGRQDRRHEPCIEDIDALADALTRELEPLEGPLAFFGHSMGAVVAFEVARRREREGAAAPLVVFASGRRAPGTHRDESVHLRDRAGVVAEMKLLGGTNSRLLADPEILDMVLPAVRSDYRAIERYRCAPDAVIGSPITVLTGADDPRTSAEEAAAWRAHTTGAFEVRTFPGGHFFLEAQSRGVLDTVSATLAGATA